MTQTQETELSKALARLAKSRLTASPVALDSQMIYVVPSQSEKNRTHAVYMVDGKWVCDCFYGRQEGHICVHKAAAYVAANPEIEQQYYDIAEPVHTPWTEADHAAYRRYIMEGGEVDPDYQPEPIMARNDTGPRLYRESPKLPERVKEAW
jgi:hypothetical protein